MDDFLGGLCGRILIAPLAAAVVIWLICRKSEFYGEMSELMERWGGGYIALIFLLGSTWFAFEGFSQVRDGTASTPYWYVFLSAGDLDVTMNWSLDRLSTLMMLVVCGVSVCIMIYSFGYMHDDPGISRFYAKLSLFVFAMLGVVLSGNLLMMFIFWELVGLCSYLLIGFWYERPAAAEAGKKAFIVNRLGDFGFLLGIMLVWSTTGSVNFDDIGKYLTDHSGSLNIGVLTAASLLLFCGAIGKSAQFPLHVWLPDAMEGPTPVSALIHAATMVAAGVYMLCRVSFLIFLCPVAMQVIAWIGGITALMAALIATQQNDIKRILAYSTLSQLGYMVMAVGLADPHGSGYLPAMFHLSTHAFFKALLFLCAGSVIIGFHHGEQNIWKMGGLVKRMPITAGCFAVGTLALCGFPFLSGFYSKEAILGLAYGAKGSSFSLFILAVVTAGLTTFYMFRCYWVAFLGKPRSPQAEHVHESPVAVTGILVVLALFSVIGGYGWFGIPGWLVGEKGMSEEHASYAVMASALLAFVAGGGLAFLIYRTNPELDPLSPRLGGLHKLLWHKFYFDEVYQLLVDYVQGGVAALCGFFDRWIIAGMAVRGSAGLVRGVGQGLRLFQTGNLQTYALWFAVGLTIILYCLLP